MATIDRIKEFLVLNSMSNYSLEKKLHLSNGYLSKAKNPSADILEQFLQMYPQISAEWLLRGEGEMYRVLENKPSLSDRLSAALDEETYTDIQRRVLEGVEEKMNEMAEAAVRDAFSKLLKKA